MFASYLPQGSSSSHLEDQIQQIFEAVDIAEVFYPTMYQPTMGLPVTLQSSALFPSGAGRQNGLTNYNQGAVHPGFGVAGATANFHQGPSTTVGGRYTGANAAWITHQGEGYGYRVDGTRMPNYEVQAAAYPTTSLISPTFHINNARFQQSIYPFSNMSIGNTVATTPESGSQNGADLPRRVNTGRYGQAIPATNWWPDVMQGGGAGASNQVGPQRHHRTKSRASRSNANEPYPKVGTRVAAPGPVVQPEQLAQTSDSGAKQENAEGKELARTIWKGDEEYHCHCGKWVLERQRVRHETRHNVEWPCRICQVLKEYRPVMLSRKDALKRHIIMQHPNYKDLMERPDLKLLELRQKDAPEELDGLEQAIEHLSTAGRQTVR